MDNIIDLHKDLAEKLYKHGSYQAFTINDPKHRQIHKATVRDRLFHHAIYRVLYPYFDRKFIYDSYSCRVDKGTLAALDRFREFGRKISLNHTKTAWVLKCDIRKFFANIDHEMLKSILQKYIGDVCTLRLLEEIIDSFHVKNHVGIGLPLGNLTSQLFVNVYMNEFDQFMKRVVKAKCYIRYTDDFVVLSADKKWLEGLIPEIQSFLSNHLKLHLHPDKVFIKTLSSGVDFLGWVHFPDHRIMRTATKRRMLRQITKDPRNERVQSYLGLLSHGNEFQLKQKIIDELE